MGKWAFLKNSKAHSSHAKQTSKIKKLILTAHYPKKLQKNSAPNIAIEYELPTYFTTSLLIKSLVNCKVWRLVWEQDIGQNLNSSYVLYKYFTSNTRVHNNIRKKLIQQLWLYEGLQCKEYFNQNDVLLHIKWFIYENI